MNSETPTYRISVLMGVYNCAPTLREALDSLLAQTYQNFKVILCDDGSKDSTPEIAREYAEKHPGKFIFIRNDQNLKLAATLNHCLEYADTEYVARMDGDDISLPTRFEKEIAFLDSHPEYALVSSPMVHFDENGDFYTSKAIEKPTKDAFMSTTPFAHAPMMMRTEILRQVQGYTTGWKTERMEDVYLWYKVYRQGYKGYNLQEPLYKMRDGREARARRMSPMLRLQHFPTSIEIGRGLGLKHTYRKALFDLCKIVAPLLPYSLYQRLRLRNEK